MKRKIAQVNSDVCLFDDEPPAKEQKQQVITLTKQDLHEIIHIATERHTKNLAAQVKERKSVPRNGLILGIQGLIGEWLLHSLFNLDKAHLYDTTPRNFQNDVTRDGQLLGKKIEVKTTYNHRYGIRVEERETRNPADYYVLVTAEREQKDAAFSEDETIKCIFHGFVSGPELLQPKNLQTWQDGKKYYCLPNVHFRDWNYHNPEKSQ